MVRGQTSEEPPRDADGRDDAAPNPPVVLPSRCEVVSALGLLDRTGQAMGFVHAGDGLVGVVTVEDLRFAWDWTGPGATVSDAMTFGLIEVGRGADPSTATEAFSDGLRRWITARHEARSSRTR